MISGIGFKKSSVTGVYKKSRVDEFIADVNSSTDIESILKKYNLSLINLKNSREYKNAVNRHFLGRDDALEYAFNRNINKFIKMIK